MKKSIEPTARRVIEHTPPEINERIRTLMRSRVRELATRLDDIEQRLNEIDQEWDIERTLEANAATLTLAGLILSLRWRKMILLPMAVAGFLLQHAVQGWCPPVSVFRRMGIRTMKEMDQERYALKAVRGDFEPVHDAEDDREKAEAALRSAGYSSPEG